MVGILSIANGGGRLCWGWISDLATRKTALVFMFLIQAVLFWGYPSLTLPRLLGIAAFAIVLCFAGEFGIMPALAVDYFGSKNLGSVYGLCSFRGLLLPRLDRLRLRTCVRSPGATAARFISSRE